MVVAHFPDVPPSLYSPFDMPLLACENHLMPMRRYTTQRAPQLPSSRLYGFRSDLLQTMSEIPTMRPYMSTNMS